MNKAKDLILATVKEAVSENEPAKLDRANSMIETAYSLGAITDNDMSTITKHILTCRIFCGR